MKQLTKILILSIIILFGISLKNNAQTYSGLLGQETEQAITTAVPFLGIAPDARAGAMGDVGVASSPDANSMHWNPAKYAFIESDMGFSISYSPWLKKLVDDISLMYLAGYKKLNDRSAISMSLLYFSLGEIQFTDAQGQSAGSFSPNEWALDMAYSNRLSKTLSLGVAFRYIHSEQLTPTDL